MIKDAVSGKVLVVGPDYRVPRGGIAQLLNTYSEFFETYNFISTTAGGSGLTKLYQLVVACRRLLYALMFRSIKIVHIHAATDISFYRKSIFILLAKLFRVKIVLSLHAGDMLDFYDRNPRRIKFILDCCDVIIALSPYWKREFTKRDFCSCIACIPNAVEEPRIDYKKVRNGKVKILFLGTICENKGIFDVIECFIRHKSFLQDKVILNICGVGDVARLDKMIIEGHLSGFVNSIGWVDSFQKQRLLIEADILIQPSYIESFGIAIVEGMAYRLPVIGSKTGGIPDLIDDGVSGFLIEAGNMVQFVEKLQVFIDNPQLIISMGECAFEKSKQYYSAIIEEKLSDLYTKLL